MPLVKSEKGSFTMAEKIDIADLKQISFSDKNAKLFTEALADPKSKLGLGSVAAYSAAFSASLALKALRCCPSDDADVKHADEQLEKLRTYFVFLIDEENKAKLPLEKRLSGNAPEEEIEAGYRTACIILDEVIYTTVQMLDLIESISDKICSCSAYLASASVFHARNAMESARLLLASYSSKMAEPVYAHTTRREPEIAIEGVAEKMNALIAKFEAKILKL